MNNKRVFFLERIGLIIIKITITIVLLLSFSSHTYAVLDDYTVLAPLPGTTDCDSGSLKQITTTKNADGTVSISSGCKSKFETYLPGVFNLAIGIAAVLAFIMLTYGGIKYMTSDAIGGKSEGRSNIENALWGLLLVISAWVILNTINPQLLKFDFNLKVPTTFDQSVVDIAIIDQASKNNVATAADMLSGTRAVNDEKNREALAATGVAVNHQPCTESKPTSCTNVDKLTPDIIQSLGIIQADACNGNNNPSCKSTCTGSNGTNRCALTITGGDESELHNTNTTHGNGSTVDMAPTSVLNAYLTKNATPKVTSPVNNTKVQVNGMTFVYEVSGANTANNGAHWHVTKP